MGKKWNSSVENSIKNASALGTLETNCIYLALFIDNNGSHKNNTLLFHIKHILSSLNTDLFITQSYFLLQRSKNIVHESYEQFLCCFFVLFAAWQPLVTLCFCMGKSFVNILQNLSFLCSTEENKSIRLFAFR